MCAFLSRRTQIYRVGGFFIILRFKRRLNDKMEITLGEVLIVAQLALINFGLIGIYNEIKKRNAGRL